MNLDGVHGNVLVGHHDVERVGDLAQLATVVHIVGLHLPAVYYEGDVCRAVQLTHGLFGVRLLVCQLDKLPRVDFFQRGDGVLLVLHLVAASAEVGLHYYVSILVPCLSVDGVGIAVSLRCVIHAADVVAVVGIEFVDAVALKDNVLPSSADDEGLQACFLIAVSRADDGCEGTVAVAGHAQVVEHDVECEDGSPFGGSYLQVFRSHHIVVVREAQCVLRAGGGSGQQGGCYDEEVFHGIDGVNGSYGGNGVNGRDVGQLLEHIY